ncbi:Equilibrative nucleoside transporter 4 [Pseudolycoriella hygida]|uniref:Equilibrative nucleoside transporter 4 n=1 Tax=Pseudolycoriella hygida TaxID=35572 RepID=A0A9Q0N9A9_9DIPT|nr:Equilibrative nucleoside transporter 4 [Pseudolycoriella hygida]
MKPRNRLEKRTHNQKTMENEENQTNTYSPLELEGRRNTDSPESDHIPPRDANLCVYVGLVMAGIGFVLPYNSFIIASDFWQTRFPGRSVALDMSMTYIIVAFATVLLNNVFLSLFSFKVRILFGYMISLSTFLFVSICEVAVEVFSTQTAYSANLVAVSLTAIGCTVQQSSFYGFASMFPKQYTQAVMTGESLAGFVVASTRILTKLLITNDRVSTFFFLLMSVCYIAASYAFHSITIHSPFVRYHTKQCAKIVLRPDEDAVECDGAATRYGVLSLDSNSSPQVTSPPTGLSFSNPVYELSNPSAGESTLEGINNLQESLTRPQDVPNVAYKVEHIITPGTCASGRFGNFKSGLESRWRVAHAIYPYMVSIALAYCVTLSLYPGIETEIMSCSLKSWMPVLLMFTFNTSDLIGKMISITPYNWTRRQLILLSGMRTVLIPLLLLCCAPRSRPVIKGETPAFIFSAALGVTNGLAGSLPMMLAPSKVPVTLKEVTGNMMTLSYNVGLTTGSLIGK